MKKITPLIAISFLFLSAHSQKMPNSLLWKISGNGLQKPSYLYGTMHLTDERLFLLGDSLYNAIEKSEGFAIEVDPQEITGYLITQVEKTLNNVQTLKDILDEKKFKKYSSALAKKFNKPADKVTPQDIFREKNKWITESFSNGKMTTFLDVYLFDIAHRLGKWTGGVEDMKDQRGLVNNLIDESDIAGITADNDDRSKSAMETMIRLYTRGDINGIDSISNFSDSAYRDQLLIKRNIKMARRMDSLGHLRSMVFAIGAAHLPGSEGVITLLKKKGFAVEPVFSSQKIQPEDYHVKEIAKPWLTIDDSLGYYSVQMPGTPGNVNMFGLVQMKMYFDIFSSSGFIVTSVRSPYSSKALDSTFSSVAENLFKKEDIQKGKKIVINNVEGLDVEGINNDTYRHGYLLRKDNVLYMAVGVAIKTDGKIKETFNRFLQSFKPLPGKTGEEKIETYIDSVYAYSVDLPSQPQPFNNPAKNEASNSMHSHLKVCMDNKTGTYFFLGVNEVKPGFYIDNDSVTLVNIHAGAKEQAPGTIADTMYIKDNNRVLEYTGRMKNAGLTMKAAYYFRGNRWYALVAMFNDQNPHPAVDRFFTSFKLLEYPASHWSEVKSTEGNFTSWAPSNFTYTAEDDSTSTIHLPKYEAFDNTRSNSYIIIQSKLGKYFWQNSDSLLWEHITQEWTFSEDSLLSRQNVSNAGLKGVELFLQQKGSRNITRKRLIIAGDKLYTLIAVLSAEQAREENITRFFETFSLQGQPANPGFAYTSKASLLITDLASADSTTRAGALTAIYTAPFTKKDLPLLHQALMQPYTIDSNYYYNTPINNISNALIKLNDSSSLAFAIQAYPSAKAELKNSLLTIISSFKTKENFAQLPVLLAHFPPSKEPSYQFINNLTDSIALAAAIIEPLLPLLKDTLTAGAIIQVANRVYDSSLITFKTLAPYLTAILLYADLRYKALKRDDHEYNSGDGALITLLGKFNTPAANNMLRKWTGAPDLYMAKAGIEQLLQNKQPVPVTAINKLAADKYYRISIYQLLKRYKKQAIFPVAYLSQKQIAESNLFQLASEDEEPQRMVFYMQKTVVFKNKNARFYFFKIYYGDGDEAYLGCSGPFNTNAAIIDPEKIRSNLLYKDSFNSEDAVQQMKQLTDEMEQWKEDE